MTPGCWVMISAGTATGLSARSVDLVGRDAQRGRHATDRVGASPTAPGRKCRRIDSIDPGFGLGLPLPQQQASQIFLRAHRRHVGTGHANYNGNLWGSINSAILAATWRQQKTTQRRRGTRSSSRIAGYTTGVGSSWLIRGVALTAARSLVRSALRAAVLSAISNTARMPCSSA